MKFVEDYSSEEFGPDCMCELCIKYGWHDCAPFWAKLRIFVKKLFKK